MHVWAIITLKTVAIYSSCPPFLLFKKCPSLPLLSESVQLEGNDFTISLPLTCINLFAQSGNGELGRRPTEPRPLNPVTEGPEDYQEITEAMLKASLLETNSVPAPHLNGHRPLKAVSSSDPLAPPVPPRTYSQRPHMSNGSVQQHQAMPPAASKPFSDKPIRPYNLSNFRFIKLLGKGSFGKVRVRLAVLWTVIGSN